MSTFSLYSSDAERMQAMVQLLRVHSWIYDLQMTHFFKEEVWRKIPIEWQSTLLSLSCDELNNLPFGFIQQSWPDSLKYFCRMCDRLALPRETAHTATTTTGCSKQLTNGMSPKKQHEVTHMAAVVNNLCTENGVNCVVDVGCGLGYLGQILGSCYGYRVIGLESVAARTHSAEKHARKIDLSPSQFETVTFELQDTAECASAFEKLLAEKLCKNAAVESCKRLPRDNAIDKTVNNRIADHHATSARTKCCTNALDTRMQSDTAFTDDQPYSKTADGTATDINTQSCSAHSLDNEQSHSHSSDIFMDCMEGETLPRICLVGLHCCADLSPISLRLFAQLPCISCLVSVGCCYHRLSKTDDQHGFRNFPLSNELKSILYEAKEACPSLQLNAFALRLAAQETRARWRTQSVADHEAHTRNVAFRAVLELEGDIQLKRLNRKLAKRKDYTNFDTYLDAVFGSIEQQADECRLRASLKTHYETHQGCFHYIEPFTALQVMLQPVIESLIILDRLQFIRECNVHANVTPIFDDAISPRNLALIGWKPD